MPSNGSELPGIGCCHALLPAFFFGLTPRSTFMPEPSNIRVLRTRRRRSAAIQVKGGEVEVRVPESMSDAQVDALLERKARWIEKALQREAQMPVYCPKEYTDGETFLYLGQSYPLAIEQGTELPPQLSRGRLLVSVPQDLSASQCAACIREQLECWYMQTAQEQLRETSRRYAASLDVQFRSVCVAEYKSRWGSCSIDGDIRYNWKIILAPQHVVDYLVVHELSHLRHHNHSARFWHCVESIFPDYRQRRSWLRNNGQLLRID